jgi:hypothetical protein
MSTGIPSENLSIPSFMALPMSEFAAAETVALVMGMSGEALLCVVATTSSRLGVEDQRIIKRCEGAEDTPTVSRARLVLAIFG